MDEHRERYGWGTLIFRKDGRTECPRDEATEVRVKGRHYTRDIWWPWPESAKTVEMIEQVAQGAYALGKLDAQEAMRKALGIERDGETEFFR